MFLLFVMYEVGGRGWGRVQKLASQKGRWVGGRVVFSVRRIMTTLLGPV